MFDIVVYGSICGSFGFVTEEIVRSFKTDRFLVPSLNILSLVLIFSLMKIAAKTWFSMRLTVCRCYVMYASVRDLTRS